MNATYIALGAVFIILGLGAMARATKGAGATEGTPPAEQGAGLAGMMFIVAGLIFMVTGANQRARRLMTTPGSHPCLTASFRPGFIDLPLSPGRRLPRPPKLCKPRSVWGGPAGGSNRRIAASSAAGLRRM